MGNCWSKEGGKVTYSQKRDRIKMWVESQSNVEEIRSNPERTKLVRIKGMSDISVLSPALAMSKTSLNSSVIFFDAKEYLDSGDEESAYDDTIFQEVVGDRAQWDTERRRELPVIKTEPEGVNLWNLLCKNIGKEMFLQKAAKDKQITHITILDTKKGQNYRSHLKIKSHALQTNVPTVRYY